MNGTVLLTAYICIETTGGAEVGPLCQLRCMVQYCSLLTSVSRLRAVLRWVPCASCGEWYWYSEEGGITTQHDVKHMHHNKRPKRKHHQDRAHIPALLFSVNDTFVKLPLVADFT